MPFNSETAAAAGRKSKRGISIRNKYLDELFSEEKAKKVFKKLEELAEKGDLEAIKTYMAYCYGKPEAKVDVTSDGEQIGYDLSKLSTDHLNSLRLIKKAIEN